MGMRHPYQWNYLVAVFLACMSADVIAARCNQRLDHASNPLLDGRLDEPLLQLAKQEVWELQEWECRDLPCSGTRRITRFDQKGRVTELEDSGVLLQISYEGGAEYPSHRIWTMTRDGLRTKGAVLREESEKYTTEGLRAGEIRWISNGAVATFRDPESGYSEMYLRGRLFTSVEMSFGWDGFPSKTLVEQDCKVRQEANGITYVATYMKSKELPQRITNEARFSPTGDWIWNLAHLPNGGTFEQVFETLESDRKGNWTVRRNRNSNGETYTQYREISYRD